MDFSMTSAILRGLSQNYANISQHVPHDCVSGNCTFEAFNSLSVCATCNNVTPLLAKTVLHEEPVQAALFEFILTTRIPTADPTKKRKTKYGLPDGNAIWNLDGPRNGNDSAYILQVAVTAKSKFDLKQMESLKDDALLFFALSVIQAEYTTRPSGSITV